MQKNLFLKICVVAFATLLALFVAEFIVRVATVYPNTLDSNRVFDENVGFRASQKIPEIDSYGYRNRETLRPLETMCDPQKHGQPDWARLWARTYIISALAVMVCSPIMLF